jgi:hypothetical protein
MKTQSREYFKTVRKVFLFCESSMSKKLLLEFMQFAREKTNALLDSIAKDPNPTKALSFRAGPGRAHLAWQLMHIGATDDRHLNVRLKGGEPVSPENVKRFAGGSVPDDSIPSLDEIRRYLNERRSAIVEYFEAVPEEKMNSKPNDQAPWTFHEWIKVLAWHEGHHQGQSHLTLNLYKASQGAKPVD